MAQKFRKIDPRIWTDEGFAKLDRDGKLLALWLLSCSRVNRCGIVLWSAALASEETGILRDRIDTVCDTVCHTVSWAFDRPSKVVFLTRWWRYNRPDNEKALRGALSDLWDVPRNALKPYLQTAREDIPAPYRKVYDTVLDTVYRTVSPQEKEQEKEQEKDNTPADAGGAVLPFVKPKKTAVRKKTDPETDPRFVEFWAVYPRHENKSKAATAFAKLDPTPELFNTLLVAIAAQRQRGCLEPLMTEDGRSTIPHPATWIHNRRWEDDPPPTGVRPQRGHPQTEYAKTTLLDTAVTEGFG